jgi:hypothetical protein
MPKPDAKTDPITRNVETAMKAERALSLRLGGATYEQIARQLGYSNRGGAYNLVHQALKAMLREPAEQVRELEVARLDTMVLAYTPAMLRGDVKAGGMLLHVMERRARLLGLDAPVRVDLMQIAREEARKAGISEDALLTAIEDIHFGQT